MSNVGRIQTKYVSKKYRKNRCYAQVDGDEYNIDKPYNCLILYFNGGVKKSALYTKISNIRHEETKFDFSFNFDEEKKFDYIITKDEALDIILSEKI